ncbi:flagellar hook-length control protein FliK, partial [Georgenia subflava]
ATPAAQPASAPTPPPARTDVPLAGQLTPALARLRTAPEGTHVLNLRIDPEHLGPVRITAHIAPEGVRIELLGATEQAREALRVTLTDLRRDLAATGLHADLELAEERGGDAADSQRGHEPGDPAPTGARGTTRAGDATGAAPPSPRPVHPGTVDLFA